MQKAARPRPNECWRSQRLAGWAAGGHYTRGYWGELDRFARAVLGQTPPTPTLDDGVAAMRLIDGIMESVRGGAPVAMAGAEPA